MNRTSIAWVKNPDGSDGFTWNPFAGCKPISAGCENCYASRLASTRLAHLPQYAGLVRSSALAETFERYKWTGEVRFFPEKLAEPFRRRKPTGIFVCDMGDLFHEAVTNEQIAAMFGVMAATQMHRYFVLTKRARRMREWFEWVASEGALHVAKRAVGYPREARPLGPQDFAFNNMLPHVRDAVGYRAILMHDLSNAWPLPNVRLGVTVENQRAADERIPLLLEAPAAVRFISMEPLLEKVDIERYVFEPSRCKVCRSSDIGYDPNPKDLPAANPERPTCLMGCTLTGEPGAERCNRCQSLEVELLPRLDWVIAGGESGPSARPCNVEWIRSIVRQCGNAGTVCFVKQLGANPWAERNDKREPHSGKACGTCSCALEEDGFCPSCQALVIGARRPLGVRDRVGADPAEWPEDLKVRQFPSEKGSA